jgi:hypothetical protein
VPIIYDVCSNSLQMSLQSCSPGASNPPFSRRQPKWRYNFRKARCFMVSIPGAETFRSSQIENGGRSQPPAQPAIETPLQSLEAAYAKIRGELKAELLDLCPSEAVGGNSGPYGDSKVRRRVARAARNQRDFHHHVGFFEGCERLLLEDRE